MAKRKNADFFMIDHDRKLISVHFPGVMDLIDYQPPWNQTVYSGHMKHGRGGKEWLGPTTGTSDAVIKGALLGDSELYAKHLKGKISRLRKDSGRFDRDYVQRITVARRRPQFGSSGDELDIHRVYQGQIDKAWRKTVRIEVSQETRLVTLFIQIADVSYVSAVDSLWRAAVAILLMEDLLKAGKSVKIVVGGYSRFVTKADHSMTVSIVVKNYNEKLSVERLAAMTHLGFYRTFGFGAKACQPYKLSSGLGCTSDMYKDVMPIQFKEDVHSGHAKFIILDRCEDSTGALASLNHAYNQMEEFSNAQ